MTNTDSSFINENLIAQTLEAAAKPDSGLIDDILDKAAELKGLDAPDIAALMNISDPEQLSRLFETARKAKDEIYGKRLVVFAPLYISNLCSNECLYCAFRASNTEIKRRALTQPEIAAETKSLIDQGHKRLLLVAGESYPKEGLDYIFKSIETVYSVKTDCGEIRRVNVNLAPLTLDEFKALKQTNIGTYQIFQETYHRETYAKVHLRGKKRDYDWRVSSLDRAMEAGIDDLGIGVLFGLVDWRFEVLALMQHVKYLEGKFGIGPHTISVPRLEPACGSDISAQPPFPVSDVDFRKIVAILRLAVPYTGLIMSTRETADIRRETFALGVSQISAGSKTNPGGYAEDEDKFDSAQFSLGDHRPLDEVIRDVASLGYVPSFCTGCYRLGRTGQDFMDLAKPGEIKKHCGPNALSTFMEYLRDYATAETRVIGEKLIADTLDAMDPEPKRRSENLLAQVKKGGNDAYC